MIYVASRASVEKYPREWRRLRAHGWPINSTWIDEAGEGETACMSALWTRIEAEVRAARGVVLWAEEEDFPLKGAFIEVGMAIGMGKPVAVYTKTAFDNRNYRPFGSWMNHPLVQRCFSLESAMTWVLKQPLPVGVGVTHHQTFSRSDADDEEPVGRCPWCGATGVGFADAEQPSDYCGHDPALVRERRA